METKKNKIDSVVDQNVSEFDKKVALYKKVMESIDLYNPSETQVRTSTTFSKDTLKTYMRNPYANEKQLRNLSRFLRNRSQIYKKIIADNASMINTNYRQVIPNYSFKSSKRKQTKPEKIRKSYFETIEFVDKMNLATEMLKVYLECWTCDVFYGVYYYYKDQGGIMLPLNPDYCKIIGLYPTGDFAFAFDCSYFSGKSTSLEMWGEPFTSMYKAYQSGGANEKWQKVPDEYACCMKVNLEDYETALPPYMTLFYSLIDLEDLKDLMAIEEQDRLYKMIYMTMPLFSNSNLPDDFSVDPVTVIKYYNMIKDSIPDSVASFVSPVEIKQISFDNDQTSDINKVENSAKNILKTAGHVALADPNGATAMSAALKADEDYAISSLLPQTEAWVNRMVSYHISNPSKVKFLGVTKYSRDEYKSGILKDMNYGVPLIHTLGILDGFSEADMIAMATFNSELGVENLYKPMQTASTQSGSSEGDDGGRPKSETPTDSGEDSADKRDSAG